MRNTNSSKIVGISDVCIQTNIGYTLVLKDVRHVLDLCLNLISGLALDQQGFENYFNKRTWRLTKVNIEKQAKSSVISTPDLVLDPAPSQDAIEDEKMQEEVPEAKEAETKDVE
ncbi:hypothetical protein F0562_023730 [Nyssa sinensis]|uniref:Retrovirus-related Pol polyprotein from transposon TNT 1-94-like beta-barrel domain-containing protein n=1 Tax=Nyssa sinensis TaxID=561372 RepID=A0A5J5BIV4_9ASTE|nr:hypothetical protein F0562_023730 [Nyssa sinensis]